MKLKIKLFAFLTITAFALNLMSCSKSSTTDNSGNNNNGGGNNNSQPLAMINYKTAVTDTLLATLYYAQNNVDFQFFGDVDATGSVQKVRAISFRRHNATDTVCNVTFDDNTRIKTIFITVNGKIDTSISKYSYSDSVSIQSIYHLDQSNQLATLQTQIVYDSITDTIRSITTFGTPSSAKFNKPLNLVLAVFGGFLFASSSLVSAPALVGAGLILYALNNVKNFNSSQTNSLQNSIDLLIPSAGAAELDTYPANTPYNPDDYIMEVDNANNDNNNLWNWCACQFNTGFNGFVHDRNVYFDNTFFGGSGYYDHSFYTGSATISNVSIQGGDATKDNSNVNGIRSISFYLKKGDGTSMLISNLDLNYIYFNYSKTFICPN